MRIFKFLSLAGLLIFAALEPCFAQGATIDSHIDNQISEGSAQNLRSTSASASARINFLTFDNRRAYFALSTGVVRNGDRRSKLNLYSPTGVFQGSTDGRITSQDGVVFGARFGVRANEYLATELETNYSRFSSLYQLSTGVETSTSQTQILSFINAIIYPLGSLSTFKTQHGATVRIDPSLLVGVGFVHDVISLSNFPHSYSKDSFASQLGAGIEGNYAQKVRLGLYYRYLMLNNPMTLTRVAEGGYVARHNLSKADAHMISAQASFSF